MEWGLFSMYQPALLAFDYVINGNWSSAHI